MPRLGAVRLGDHPARFSIEAHAEEIGAYLKRNVKPEVEQLLEEQVANFEEKPEFTVRVTKPGRNPTLGTGYGIVLEAWPRGEHADLWRMLSKGTGGKSHKIPLSPKTDGFLWYRENYEPKTRVLSGGLSSGGSGDYSGGLVKARQVTHPGFEGRRWTYHLMEEYRPRWRKHVDGVLKQAIDAARRAR